MMARLRPVFNLKHVVFDAIAKTVWIGALVLQATHEYYTHTYQAKRTHSLVDNTLRDGRYARNNPFPSLQLFCKVSCCLQEVMRKRH